MNKKVMSGFIAISLFTCIKGFLSADSGGALLSETIHVCYGLSEKLEVKLNSLSSKEERRLVASLLQLRLLKVSGKTFEKFEASEEWKMRTSEVTGLIEGLSFDDGGEIASSIYQECFEAINPENRVIPGLDGDSFELMQPNAFARRAFKSY